MEQDDGIHEGQWKSLSGRAFHIPTVGTLLMYFLACTTPFDGLDELAPLQADSGASEVPKAAAPILVTDSDDAAAR